MIINHMLSYMQLQGQWRDYQKRVLDELQDHLEDTKLHIVAAPGSGKTVLGLEVMRKLARPASDAYFQYVPNII